MRVGVVGKGGSGKSTSTAALGDALSRDLGLRVQLLDTDAQASLTAWLLPDLGDRYTVDDVLSSSLGLQHVVHPLRERLAVVPAANGLALVEPTLHPHDLEQRVLGPADADVVVIDTPASRPLGPGAVLLRSVLAAVDVVVVPFRTSVLDLDALQDTLGQVRAHEQLTGRVVPTLLLPTMTTRDGAAELVVRALRVGGLQVLPSVPLSSWAPKATAARALIADRAPRGTAIVEAYADAASVLLATINASVSA